MSNPPRKPKLGVLLSGSGRTLDNLCVSIENADLDAQIALVVASRDCLGAEKAIARNIPTKIIKGELSKSQLDALVDEFELDLVILAGYLRRVPITDKTRGRIINIHPALLPNFGGAGMHGMHVHRAAIDAYKHAHITQSGCTVHYCDENYDTGAIILQRACDITDEDTPETLAAKVFALECEIYPNAIARVLASI